MGEYVEISLTDCTRIIIDEVAFLRCRQKEVAWTYGMALLSERRGRDNPDWKAINAAILDRWKPSGLERIKRTAWKLATGETPARRALTVDGSNA